MRKIQRLPLPTPTVKDLERKQNRADLKFADGYLDSDAEWRSARQTKPIKDALRVLQKMAGNRQRCMYCGDSHGTDIEHFWPKRGYPKRMFLWLNMLLCCTECGRFKGDDFPLDHGQPLLVDPTCEDPWQFLDFDPATGNIVARFDPVANDWTAKGLKTVEALNLDCREALAASYQHTHRRLKALVEAALHQTDPQPDALAAALSDADDHGLLGWYFTGTGIKEEPFASLLLNHPAVWQCCRSIVH